MRELEETVRVASSLHAQLKRSVAALGSSHPQKQGGDGCWEGSLAPPPAALLLTRLLSRTGVF